MFSAFYLVNFLVRPLFGNYLLVFRFRPLTFFICFAMFSRENLNILIVVHQFCDAASLFCSCENFSFCLLLGCGAIHRKFIIWS